MKNRILKNIQDKICNGPFLDSWDSLENYTIPEWYKDSKLGIFIHWGVYSVPAFGNEWYPRNMYIQGTKEFDYHVKNFGLHNQFGYKDFIPMFKAENFNAEEWIELFHNAGAKFVVPVAEHHDGFQMYGSMFSKWNAPKMGPKRDIIGELADAAGKKGMVFGLSSHRAEHWWFMAEGKKFDSDVRDPKYSDFYGPANGSLGIGHNRDNYITNSPDQDFLEDWLMRTCELIEKYQPQLLWFDWWIMNLAFKPYLKKLAAFYYNSGAEWGKGVAINYKYDAFPIGTAVLDIERGQLSNARPLLWQNDTSVSKNSWGYIKDQEYKTTNDIICDLVDVVSKNGVLLLNIGPRPDGTIPEEEQKILLEIGQWLKVNGEAIFETRPWISFGEGPTKVMEGAFTDTKRESFTSEDIRFTFKNDTLYAIVLKMPVTNNITIKTLALGNPYSLSAIKNIKGLGDVKVKEWSCGNDGMNIKVEINKKIDTPIVIAISI